MAESELFKELAKIRTETINPESTLIDTLSTVDMLELINSQDALVPLAVKQEIPQIAQAVEIVYNAFKNGGRLFYFGAGTSGRLGIVDASECPPTYGSDPEMVQGIIAGGKEAVFRSQEGAEDKPESGADLVVANNISPIDVVCGIAASGRTPFVIGALEKACEFGAKTILISTVDKKFIIEKKVKADIIISPNVGAEVITGSTRMKSGTAQKLVLNMISTAAMIKLGKTYGNIMVDLQPTNKKLVERSKKTLMMVTGVDYDEAEQKLIEADWHVKTAIVMILANTDSENAKKILEITDGKVRAAIELIKANPL